MALVAAVVVAGCTETAPTASGGGQADVNRVAYQSSVRLAVGQSAIVHGKRSDQCGVLPSEAELASAKANLDAQTELGEFSFGNPGVRRSGSCRGNTPVRETIFTATAPGQQVLRVHGDPVRVTVTAQ
ncbi:MAG: hypothetical protein JKP98_08555 [Rhodobacteraceae bacterium]|nr:hypothetical protein [Paracoccaceae bacterium]MBL4557153.1 hypothetical protein [Paracoccaceae bacterium]HBG98309.1 hypothetical protein [Paracoccaceae bacterium]